MLLMWELLTFGEVNDISIGVIYIGNTWNAFLGLSAAGRHLINRKDPIGFTCSRASSDIQSVHSRCLIWGHFVQKLDFQKHLKTRIHYRLRPPLHHHLAGNAWVARQLCVRVNFGQHNVRNTTSLNIFNLCLLTLPCSFHSRRQSRGKNQP